MAKKRGRKGKKGKKPKVDCKFKITNEMLKPMNESKYTRIPAPKLGFKDDSSLPIGILRCGRL